MYKTLKCDSCKKKWTLIDGVMLPNTCPFCGSDLQMLEYSDLMELRRYVEERGLDVVRDRRVFLALVKDFIPGNQRIQTLLRLATNEGIIEELLEGVNSDENKNRAGTWKIKMRAINYMGMTEDNASQMLDVAKYILGYEENKGNKHRKTRRMDYADRDDAYYRLGEREEERKHKDNALALYRISGEAGNVKSIIKYLELLDYEKPEGVSEEEWFEWNLKPVQEGKMTGDSCLVVADGYMFGIGTKNVKPDQGYKYFMEYIKVLGDRPRTDPRYILLSLSLMYMGLKIDGFSSPDLNLQLKDARDAFDYLRKLPVLYTDQLWKALVECNNCEPSEREKYIAEGYKALSQVFRDDIRKKYILLRIAYKYDNKWFEEYLETLIENIEYYTKKKDNDRLSALIYELVSELLDSKGHDGEIDYVFSKYKGELVDIIKTPIYTQCLKKKDSYYLDEYRAKFMYFFYRCSSDAAEKEKYIFEAAKLDESYDREACLFMLEQYKVTISIDKSKEIRKKIRRICDKYDYNQYTEFIREKVSESFVIYYQVIKDAAIYDSNALFDYCVNITKKDSKLFISGYSELIALVKKAEKNGIDLESFFEEFNNQQIKVNKDIDDYLEWCNYSSDYGYVEGIKISLLDAMEKSADVQITDFSNLCLDCGLKDFLMKIIDSQFRKKKDKAAFAAVEVIAKRMRPDEDFYDAPEWLMKSMAKLHVWSYDKMIKLDGQKMFEAVGKNPKRFMDAMNYMSYNNLDITKLEAYIADNFSIFCRV